MGNMMKMIVLALAATMTLVGCISEKKGVGDLVEEGDPVPAFTVTNPSGDGTKAFTQADFVGKRSMIVFFATWCPDCRRELPIVHEAWRRLAERPDFQFIAISREEAAADVAKYWTSVTETKPSFEPMPWWLDTDASAFRTFADSYIPRIYLADTSGKIAMVAVETFDLTSDTIVKLIEDLE